MTEDIGINNRASEISAWMIGYNGFVEIPDSDEKFADFIGFNQLKPKYRTWKLMYIIVMVISLIVFLIPCTCMLYFSSMFFVKLLALAAIYCMAAIMQINWSRITSHFMKPTYKINNRYVINTNGEIKLINKRFSNSVFAIEPEHINDRIKNRLNDIAEKTLDWGWDVDSLLNIKFIMIESKVPMSHDRHYAVAVKLNTWYIVGMWDDEEIKPEKIDEQAVQKLKV